MSEKVLAIIMMSLIIMSFIAIKTDYMCDKIKYMPFLIVLVFDSFLKKNRNLNSLKISKIYLSPS